jgi:XTP/dITP diphosphohydrolase
VTKPRPRFVLATGNRHKLTEFSQILAPYEVVLMPEGLVLPPEGVESFAANARGKALALARASTGATGLLFLGDDSGLEVEALGWAPGVTSARYAGVDGPGADAANVQRLLRDLGGRVGSSARRARFVCSLVAVSPDLTDYAATGLWWGAIADEPRGRGGFGYDPVFVPEGSDLTVAEWPQAEKDEASHRALAAKALLQRLRQEGALE